MKGKLNMKEKLKMNEFKSILYIEFLKKLLEIAETEGDVTNIESRSRELLKKFKRDFFVFVIVCTQILCHSLTLIQSSLRSLDDLRSFTLRLSTPP